MAYPFLMLNRLRVLRGGASAYDQVFHAGVNIIRGENGSGKSTIADFIFFILGGEFSAWKEVAGGCNEVQAEVITPRGKLTLRREVTSAQAPMWIFFGDFEEAQQHAIETWERFPIRRQGRQESSSQVLFRSLAIPEAQSEGASNITMHQILRLLYSDQQTPATRLFRFDQWDKQNIREAVGDLICGISGYEAYEVDLKLRNLQKELEHSQSALKGLFDVMPPGEGTNTPELINSRIEDLRRRKLGALDQISRIDEIVDESHTKEFLTARKLSQKKLLNIRSKISFFESNITTAKIELNEVRQFLEYLNEMLEKIAFAEATSQAVGAIDFTHCPACLTELVAEVSAEFCNVCGSERDPQADRSKYNQIRLDFEMQIRESNQILDQKTVEVNKGQQELRRLHRRHEQLVSEFSIRFDLSSSPREGFLAQRNNEIGQIDGEIRHILHSLETAEKIQKLLTKKAELQAEIKSLQERRKTLAFEAKTRRSIAMREISQHATNLLRGDINRQAEFQAAHAVSLSFLTDAVYVDEKINFAESSNVFLKNSAILALFLAAGDDEAFLHPRFLLFDNVEDKGMEPERSHRFQELIVQYVTAVSTSHQVIYTTSMINPKLELDKYVVGPHYTHDHRTLDLRN